MCGSTYRNCIQKSIWKIAAASSTEFKSQWIGYAICWHGGTQSLVQALEADDSGRLRRALLLCGTAWENQIEVPKSVPQFLIHPKPAGRSDRHFTSTSTILKSKTHFCLSCMTRMDYDTTAQPWFLQPRWNTSGWAEHISNFGPQGVHDHKATREWNDGIMTKSHPDLEMCNLGTEFVHNCTQTNKTSQRKLGHKKTPFRKKQIVIMIFWESK